MFLTETSFSSFIWPIVIGISLGLLIAFRRNSASLKLTYLEAEDFRNNMRKGQLIDIREKEAFSQEKINGARNFPNKEAISSLHLLRKDQPVFIYSDSDFGKVRKVGKKIRKKGFSSVYVLICGLDKWPYPKK